MFKFTGTIYLGSWSRRNRSAAKSLRRDLERVFTDVEVERAGQTVTFSCRAENDFEAKLVFDDAFIRFDVGSRAETDSVNENSLEAFNG